ncbi:MAG TPA: hypothetical protein VLF94_00115 [Chlamydiales bacterium]|nr:hypothetical protein [Chlamydiales bacterium]
MNKIGFLLISNVLFCTTAEYLYLDQLAQESGTDKSSSGHNYTRAYAQYFAPMKNEKIKFLEIGIGNEESVKLWEDYFVNGDLHFIDIEDIENTSRRSKYYRLDQGSPEELDAFIDAVGGGFDIIIDDGGHTMNQQITSFVRLFPHVRSGGIYVIEDLHTSYWIGFQGGFHPDKRKATPNSTTEFLKTLIDDINHSYAKHGIPDCGLASASENLSYYQKTIDSIHFYKSLCLVTKR